jgi:hypothetical protein
LQLQIGISRFVSIYPKNPLGGVHEIQSFCLGHRNFVSCISFLGGQADGNELIVSGGGDATVSYMFMALHDWTTAFLLLLQTYQSLLIVQWLLWRSKGSMGYCF